MTYVGICFKIHLFRLFVISSTGDSAAQYINYMNVFFTAQVLYSKVPRTLQHGAVHQLHECILYRSGTVQ